MLNVEAENIDSSVCCSKGKAFEKIFLRIVYVTQCVSGVKYGIVLIFFYSKMF